MLFCCCCKEINILVIRSCRDVLARWNGPRQSRRKDQLQYTKRPKRCPLDRCIIIIIIIATRRPSWPRRANKPRRSSTSTRSSVAAESTNCSPLRRRRRRRYRQPRQQPPRRSWVPTNAYQTRLATKRRRHRRRRQSTTQALTADTSRCFDRRRSLWIGSLRHRTRPRKRAPWAPPNARAKVTATKRQSTKKALCPPFGRERSRPKRYGTFNI